MSSSREMLLRHVHVHVPDVEKVAKWYRTTLGLHEVYRFEEKLIILGSQGDCQLGLEVGPALGSPERLHLIFRVEDVDATLARLRSRNVEIDGGPEDQPYGHRVMWLKDPVGHTVELYTPLDGDRPYD